MTKATSYSTKNRGFAIDFFQNRALFGYVGQNRHMETLLGQGVRWSDDLSSKEAHFKNGFFGSTIKVLTFLYPILIQTM